MITLNAKEAYELVMDYRKDKAQKDFDSLMNYLSNEKVFELIEATSRSGKTNVSFKLKNSSIFSVLKNYFEGLGYEVGEWDQSMTVQLRWDNYNEEPLD